ncbi:MAG: hypothetical protein WBB37_09145 [bacterium]
MNSVIRITEEESGRVRVSSTGLDVGNIVPISMQNQEYIRTQVPI